MTEQLTLESDSFDHEQSEATPNSPSGNEKKPFGKVESGVLNEPTSPDWEYNGVLNDHEMNDYTMVWKGDHQMPGFEWSEKVMVVVEYVEGVIDKPFSSGYALTVYPFDENGAVPEGEATAFSQPSVDVNIYNRLRNCLKNVQELLNRLPNMETGDATVVNDRKLTME